MILSHRCVSAYTLAHFVSSWRPRLSGGSGAGVEQSAGTDQGRLVAGVFSTADKGPSVSAVVQLTSDYCHRF